MSDRYKPKEHEVRAKKFEENTNESGQELADWINSLDPKAKAGVVPLGQKKSFNKAFVWVYFGEPFNGRLWALPGYWVVYELGEFTMFADEVFKSSYDPIENKEEAI